PLRSPTWCRNVPGNAGWGVQLSVGPHGPGGRSARRVVVLRSGPRVVAPAVAAATGAAAGPRVVAATALTAALAALAAGVAPAATATGVTPAAATGVAAPAATAGLGDLCGRVAQGRTDLV